MLLGSARCGAAWRGVVQAADSPVLLSHFCWGCTSHVSGVAKGTCSLLPWKPGHVALRRCQGLGGKGAVSIPECLLHRNQW